MAQLQPINLERIIEDVTSVISGIAWVIEPIEGEEIPPDIQRIWEYRHDDPDCRMKTEYAWVWIFESGRRLRHVLNDGDIDLLDCDGVLRCSLAMTWALVKCLPLEPIETDEEATTLLKIGAGLVGVLALLKNAQRREAAGKGDDAGPPAEPLTGRAEQVYQEIIKAGQLTGKQITKRTGIDQSTLTKEIIPELKRLRGIMNKPGAGYYSPRHYRPE